MGKFARFMEWLGGGSVEPVESLSASPSTAKFSTQHGSVVIPDELTEGMTYGGLLARPVSRDVALQVPAVMRARNIMVTPATLPIEARDRNRNPVRVPLFEQIDPDVPNTVTLANTYEDLFFEGVSWWYVLRLGANGFPLYARHIPASSVAVHPLDSSGSEWISNDLRIPSDLGLQVVHVDGVPVPDERVIRFDSPNPPFLRHAARAIRTCLALDTAAARYADEPLPLGYFAPADGADPQLSNDEVQDLLDEWERARQERTWGYVGSALQPHALSWDAEKIQLADQRQHAVLEIARAAGVDPEDLGVSTTSRTYANAEQRRMDLVDFTLGNYVSAVQDRLSMNDVLARGTQAAIEFDGFLRSDTLTRMKGYEIGRRVGAITADEIREAERRPVLNPVDVPPITTSTSTSTRESVRD